MVFSIDALRFSDLCYFKGFLKVFTRIFIEHLVSNSPQELFLCLLQYFLHVFILTS
jgi:hypothetical protein